MVIYCDSLTLTVEALFGISLGHFMVKIRRMSRSSGWMKELHSTNSSIVIRYIQDRASSLSTSTKCLCVFMRFNIALKYRDLTMTSQKSQKCRTPHCSGYIQMKPKWVQMLNGTYQEIKNENPRRTFGNYLITLLFPTFDLEHVVISVPAGQPSSALIV